MNTQTNWINSGMAQEAARDLVWFVVLVFVVLGVCMWRQFKKEERDEKKRKTRN